ncbi:MAG: peptide chain release factor N(5)-glutamine methyltransferase [Micrococcales bacterium]|nr:peptide chain release factor N(5)-glutamine methyltransferase [Micrococcales bacterium]
MPFPSSCAQSQDPSPSCQSASSEAKSPNSPQLTFAAALARRIAGEPLQYILGRAAFRHGELAVGPGVMIPRPETEWLAVLAIQAALRMASPLVVDLGTGSGALAWAMASEVPAAQVHAVELSPVAASYAKRNLAGLPVDLSLADATDKSTLAHLDSQVDLVVANPPYLPSGTELGRDVAHEPDIALWGGGQCGLDLPTAFLATAARLLKSGGLVFMEIDPSQAEAISTIANELGFTAASIHPDLTGRPRILQAQSQ